MGGFIYTLLGTSKDITLGPTAIMSLLCFPVVEGQPSRAVLLTLLTGIIQAAMALLRLGERPCENLVTGASLIWVSRPLEMNLPARHFYSLDFFCTKKLLRSFNFMIGEDVTLTCNCAITVSLAFFHSVG